jgi:hypothetical protein
MNAPFRDERSRGSNQIVTDLRFVATLHSVQVKRMSATPTPSTRLLHRFTKPGGHWAELRERKAADLDAVEFFVFVDGSLLMSQMFYNERRTDPRELEARVRQFTNAGWIEERRMEERRIAERRIEDRRTQQRRLS